MSEETGVSEDDAVAAAAAAGLAPGIRAADSSFDLSLRLLTALVMFALAGSVSLLAYRWIEQNRRSSEAVPAPASTTPPAPVAHAPEVGPTHRDEVLMDPGRVFKCEEQGRVTFSDQACTGVAPAPRTTPPAGAAAGTHP